MDRWIARDAAQTKDAGIQYTRRNSSSTWQSPEERTAEASLCRALTPNEMPPPTRREKLQAQAEHLLDAYLSMRATLALLEPILFDRQVVARWGSGKRAAGLRALTGVLVNACVLQIATIVSDKDARTPSVSKLVDALEDEALVAGLREAYSVWNLPVSHGMEPEVIAAVEAWERRDEAARRQQFDLHVANLRSRWEDLRESAELKGFRAMRDKLIAHREIWLDRSGYRILDVASLGLKYGDLTSVADRIGNLVELIGLVYRNVYFSFDHAKDQTAGFAAAFWAGAEEPPSSSRHPTKE